MADGFEENVEFLELRYLDADDIDLGHAFADIAPLLWLRAGGQGPIARRTRMASRCRMLDRSLRRPVRSDHWRHSWMAADPVATSVHRHVLADGVRGRRRRAAHGRWSACTTRTCRCSCQSAARRCGTSFSTISATQPWRCSSGSVEAWRQGQRRALVVRPVGHHGLRQDRHRDRGHRGPPLRRRPISIATPIRESRSSGSPTIRR